MFSNHQTVRALDLGYGNTKFTTGSDIWSPATTQLFPSLAMPHAEADPYAHCGNPRDTTIISVNDRYYEVGPDAHLLDTVRPSSRVLSEDYIHSDQYLALVKGALSRMQTESIDLLVAGLPVQLLTQKQTALKGLLTGQHDLPDGTVRVEDALILPQPIGSLFYYALQKNLVQALKDKSILIIDQGFYTSDWLLTEGLKPMPSRCGSTPSGHAFFIKQIATSLAQHTGTPFNDTHAIEKGLKTGQFRLFGKPFDLTPFRESATTALTSLLTELQNTVGSASHIDLILLSGGGASFLHNSVRATFPNHDITAIHDAVFANVRGFQQIGTDLQKHRSRTARSQAS